MQPLFAAALNNEQLVTAVAWYFVFLTSTVCHEAAHALAALKLGDSTAYEGGQVSLNPLPHIARAPIGLVVVPLISLVQFGYPLGWASAPYDPHWALRWPKRAALMAFAGPAANLLLATVGFVSLKIGLDQEYFVLPEDLSSSQIVAAAHEGAAIGAAKLLSMFFFLNLLLATFNLLPLPPLDGSSIIPLLLRPENRATFYEYASQPAFSFIGLIIAWNMFDRVFAPVFSAALRVLYSV